MKKIKQWVYGCLFFAIFIFIFQGISWAQAFGVIQGKVVTDKGEAIEAATVYVTSPALLGIELVLTDKLGFFDLAGLPPGSYSLTVEKPGFKTVVAAPVELWSQMTVFLQIKLSPSEREGETDLAQTSLRGDAFSSETANILTRSLIDRLPLGRDLGSLLKTAPGVFLSDQEAGTSFLLLGSSERNSSYRLDGVNITDNFILRPAIDLDAAVVEQLEVVSSGQSLAEVPAGGTHLNLISRSGGNKASGDVGLLFVVDSWNKNLWRFEEQKERGVPAVRGIKNNFQPLLSFGGPFWTDRAWFFLSGRFQKQSYADVFLGPFQDVHGQSHSGYDWSRQDISGFFKISVRPIAEAKANAWINIGRSHQPVAEEVSSQLPYLSTHLLDYDQSLALHVDGQYFLDQKTLIAAKASYLRRSALYLLQEKARSSFWSDDYGDYYGPLSGADYNAGTMVEQVQGEALARKFISDFAGVRHILTAGFSYVQTTAYVDWWRLNNLVWFLDHRRPNNNFYPGQGLIGFWLCGTAENTTLVRGQTQRLGGYASDTININHRLSLSFSLRFDRISGGFSRVIKGSSGNSLSYFVGEAYVKPYTLANYPDIFPSGLNPWASLGFNDRGDFISWFALSPRAGVVVNLWGEGKTLLKASLARYHDDLTPRQLLPLHPLYPGYLSFFWLDANGDGQPDLNDEFSPQSFDFRSLSDSYFKRRVAEDLRSPSIDELSVGIEQYIGRDISLSFRYTWRHEKNIQGAVLYDPDAGKTWYQADGEGQKYWVPFTTTIPAQDEFPAQKVTFYAPSKQAPPLFWQWRNVPELERKYRGWELTFDKRMSHGWELKGTVILSKSEGNAEPMTESSSGVRLRLIDPNYFVNRYGRLSTDRPILLKLQAASQLPFGFLLSAFYQWQSGKPWARWVRVLPPADWCAANSQERVYYSVLLEEVGSRREESFSWLDARLEKKFGEGKGHQLALSLDVLNLLGSKRAILGQNDVDIWEPSAEGAGASGRLTLSPEYKLTKYLEGKRVFRFSLRLTF